MLQFGSEPKFEPELFRTGPKFRPRFGGCTEPDHKFSSGFRQGAKSLNIAEPGSNQTFFSNPDKIWRRILCVVCQGHVYNSLSNHQIVNFRLALDL